MSGAKRIIEEQDEEARMMALAQEAQEANEFAAEEEAEAEEHRAKAEAAEKEVRYNADSYEKHLKMEIKMAVSDCCQVAEKKIRIKKMTLFDCNVLHQMGLGDILKNVGDTERVNITFEFIEDTTEYMKEGRDL